MTAAVDSGLDLTISRVIAAPRARVWRAWADPARLTQWWIPAPATCEVVELDLRPGGAFETRISEDGGAFQPHVSGCFLEIVLEERLVFTNGLLGGWRPAEHPFMTAIITFEDHPTGTTYLARVMHKNHEDCTTHERLGFYDGWGTVIEQLARQVEGGAE
jgi:uncharacterized protein YndB with AHSA1/START domain